jgi:hypothetical protein
LLKCSYCMLPRPKTAYVNPVKKSSLSCGKGQKENVCKRNVNRSDNDTQKK